MIVDLWPISIADMAKRAGHYNDDGDWVTPGGQILPYKPDTAVEEWELDAEHEVPAWVTEDTTDGRSDLASLARSIAAVAIPVVLLWAMIEGCSWVVEASGINDEDPAERPTTTAPRRIAEAFDYCRERGHVAVAAELGMPSDDLSDVAFEYSLKIYRATSRDEAVSAATSCMDGLTTAALGG